MLMALLVPSKLAKGCHICYAYTKSVELWKWTFKKYITNYIIDKDRTFLFFVVVEFIGVK